MAPPSLRRILPTDTLAAYAAVPLYTENVAQGVEPSQSLPATAEASARTSTRDESSSITNHNLSDIPPIGIEIAGWKIFTRNSSIGDEKRMDLLTLSLENIANDGNNAGEDGIMMLTSPCNSNGTDTRSSRKRRRRLCPPEITFLDAILLLQYNGVKRSENEFVGVRFTAHDALLEWAEAHRFLELKNDDQQQQQQRHHHNHTTNSLSPNGQFRGVSIIRAADAKIWSEKKNKSGVDAPPLATATSMTDDTVPGNSEFYYDWTYSSPYAGTILHRFESSNKEGNDESATTTQVNNREQWQPLTESHIPFHLLQDTTQPILLFDDVYLYEDDLHDNGDVSLNIKVRVMPTCWFVLQRLFVRVDYVCIRCREVRYFCLFDEGSNNSGGGTRILSQNVRVNTIYRNIVWREASWDELGKLGLPMDPAAWREGGGHPAGRGGPQQQLASLLAQLPTVALPDDITQFACYDARGMN